MITLSFSEKQGTDTLQASRVPTKSWPCGKLCALEGYKTSSPRTLPDPLGQPTVLTEFCISACQLPATNRMLFKCRKEGRHHCHLKSGENIVRIKFIPFCANTKLGVHVLCARHWSKHQGCNTREGPCPQKNETQG